MQQTDSAPIAEPNFIEHYHDVLADFTDALGSQRFWQICPLGSEAPEGLFDADRGLQYPLKQLKAFIGSAPFLYVMKGDKTIVTLDTRTRLLWYHDGSSSAPYSTQVERIKAYQTPGLGGWAVPTAEAFKAFWARTGNPHRTGARLCNQYSWFMRETYVDVDNWNTYAAGNSSAYLFACSSIWQSLSDAALLAALAGAELALRTPDGESCFVVEVDKAWCKLSHDELLLALHRQELCLLGLDGSRRFEHPASMLPLLDWQPCRLPRLEQVRLTDPNKGLWELWGCDPAELGKLGLVARDPASDILKNNVAIDFGTSSTVVAYRDKHGASQLLRIGVRDFYEEPEAHHYENPTVLELLDYRSFSAIWQRQAYRPALDWNWLRASHEARESFRNNPGNTRVLASILPRIKQWAMRSEKERVRLTDWQQQHEISLPALVERNPVSGEPMRVSASDPFDPVELYAWYLGMAINWRDRGLYLKYHMTFPARYERAIKDKILASFRRGLQRSLPPTLVSQAEILRQFEVRELASEPAAYAAAALPRLGLEPADDGIAYAVFDFGGGTTDFAFGLWRWANDAEEEEGYQQVFESIHASGDNFLGGENLLEHLVYATFQQNLDVCREHKIPFTRPLDGERFSGDEAFVQPTQAAQTNAVVLAAKLRAFMESEKGELVSQIKISLLDVNGQSKPCEQELEMDPEQLGALLDQRIQRGFEAFLHELAQVIDQFAGKPVHVLLAGNGSRSRYLARLIAGDALPELLAKVFGTTPPELMIHAPLSIDEKDHHAPTAKTGVALGLLRLCPGEGVKLIDRVRTSSRDEAPFRYYVGGKRRGQLEVKLTPACGYESWKLLGAMPQQVFNMCYSQSPRAKGGMAEGDPELLTYRIDFPAAPAGARLYVRAIAPSCIELAAAHDDPAQDGNIIARQKLDLDTGLLIA